MYIVECQDNEETKSSSSCGRYYKLDINWASKEKSMLACDFHLEWSASCEAACCISTFFNGANEWLQVSK